MQASWSGADNTPMPAHAADILLITASVCIVALTALLLLVGVAAWRMIREARALVRTLRNSVRPVHWYRFISNWL